jgi:apolipoprotein N-acyltransferase
MGLVDRIVLPLQQSIVARLSLAGLGGLLSALSLIHPHAYPLAWVAFAPLLVAVEKSSYRLTYFCGLTFGVVHFALAAHWITDFISILKGYDDLQSYPTACLFWLYSGHLPAIVVLVDRWIRVRSRLPGVLVFPVCATFFYATFPMVFHLPIGGGQIGFLTAIQAISITGVSGLDFVIALTNAAFAGILTGQLSAMAAVPVGATLACWFGYGIASNAHWTERLENAERLRIGIVQPDQAPQLGGAERVPGFSRSYPPEMAMTERLAASGARLVIWPETHYKGYYDEPHIGRVFDHHVDSMNVFLLFPDNERRTRPGTRFARNKSVLISPEGQQRAIHIKSRLIPYGETLPLADWMPRWMAQHLRRFFRGILRELSPGDEPAPFEASELGAELWITPLICYESLFADYTASAVPDVRSSRLIAVSSNNNWFGNTFQPRQHQNAAALRAVENRAVLVHVMNNGPSMVFLPNGQRIFDTRMREAGGYVVDTPILGADPPPLFSRFPDLISGAFDGAFLLLLAASCRSRWSSRGGSRVAESRGRQIGNP